MPSIAQLALAAAMATSALAQPLKRFEHADFTTSRTSDSDSSDFGFGSTTSDSGFPSFSGKPGHHHGFGGSGSPSGVPFSMPSGFPAGPQETGSPSDGQTGSTSTSSGNSSFSIAQVAYKSYTKSGPKALAKVYNKFTRTLPAHVAEAASAATAAASGEVTATPEEYDVEYLAPVTIGGQTLNLDFDTGSADLWVFSSELSTSELSGHSYYNPSDSTTATQLEGYTWDISYGDGSGASGVVYTDTVEIGGVTATSVAVEAATSISSEFSDDTDNDGLVGLAFSVLNTVSPKSQTTWFDDVKDSLDAPLFTVDLKKSEPGTYDFGYIDASKYTGDITYVDVDDSQGYWGFAASGYTVGDGSTTSLTINGIADTGTTLMMLPDSLVNDYYSSVSGATDSPSVGGWVFSCDADLPDLSIIIGGVAFTVPGSYLNYAPVSSTQCYGGLQSDADVGITIYGDIFLKSQFVVFDYSSTPQLGFAAKDL